MKITKRQLRRLIKEELKKELRQEGFMDKVKGFFGKDEPEQETEEDFDQEAALESMNDAMKDKFFKKALVIALYFYYIKYSPDDYKRGDLAKNFLSRSTIRDAMMDATSNNAIVDKRSAMKFLDLYFGDNEQNIIADYIMKNKIGEALELPNLYDYVFSQYDKSFAADHLLKYFVEPEGRGRTQYGSDTRDYKYGYKQYRG